MGDVVPDSPVQSHAISAGLASGDDFLNHLKRLITLGPEQECYPTHEQDPDRP
jgi:hypothetical protein